MTLDTRPPKLTSSLDYLKHMTEAEGLDCVMDTIAFSARPRQTKTAIDAPDRVTTTD